MSRRLLYGTALLALLLCGLWYMRHGRDKKIDQGIAAPVLKADEKSKVIIDVPHHTVTTVRRSGTTRTFLNTHGPVAVVEKADGSTVLVQRTWGTMVGPFVGFGLGTDIRMRAAVGVNLFYVQRFNFGGGLLVGSDVRDARLFAGVSYNTYSNIHVGLGIDHKKTGTLYAALSF